MCQPSISKVMSRPRGKKKRLYYLIIIHESGVCHENEIKNLFFEIKFVVVSCSDQLGFHSRQHCYLERIDFATLIQLNKFDCQEHVNDLSVLRFSQADPQKLKFAIQKVTRRYSTEYLYIRSMHLPKMCSPDLPKKIDPL